MFPRLFNSSSLFLKDVQRIKTGETKKFRYWQFMKREERVEKRERENWGFLVELLLKDLYPLILFYVFGG